MIAKDLDLDSLCAAFEFCPRFLLELEKQRESIVPLVERGDVPLNRDFRIMEALLRPGKDNLYLLHIPVRGPLVLLFPLFRPPSLPFSSLDASYLYD